MEIVLTENGTQLTIIAMYIKRDRLVDLINNTMIPAIKVPNPGSCICIVEDNNLYQHGWHISIPTSEADANTGFAKLIVALAKHEDFLG